MKRTIPIALGMAIAAQCLILIGLYVEAQVPLWLGEPIRVKTVPVDPRSLFRGNYARLNYDFSTIAQSAFQEDQPLRQGEVVYVSLKKHPSGLYVFSSASLERPQRGIFLRGRVAGNRWSNTGDYRIKYGIEAYFAPREKALQLEDALRDGGVAELMVMSSGRAGLRKLAGDD
ncbi:GDYXXLXY domain-containing protein [Microbulbifer sp. 2205BS26-8]|uniref:GDYXXLXY domain-containing protein n=1 Tax=Microbulbifer sp. 2205BS26-8 TaxID=3064386 RepID=UPI002740026A|nr:GDYXXLXY domain-containing protein [Microbulbifer sp. 2205BS26-8]MDP5208641.1 GDYXXLXY domain-containing protein [Microbulbifer sp. 2205BS26-8]